MKSIQVRIPLTLFNEITRVKKRMIKEHKERFGKKVNVTFTKAAAEYQRNRSTNFFGGRIK